MSSTDEPNDRGFYTLLVGVLLLWLVVLWALLPPEVGDGPVIAVPGTTYEAR